MSLKSIHIALIGIVLLVGMCAPNILADKPEADEIEIYVYIKGITAKDEAKLKDLLNSIKGISKIEIEDIEDGIGEVEVHVNKDVSPETIKKSLEDAGYEVKKMEVED